MTATIATVSFVFSIILLVANGSYSSSPEYFYEVETSSRTSQRILTRTLEFESSESSYSFDPAYSDEESDEDVTHQNYGHKSDEEM